MKRFFGGMAKFLDSKLGSRVVLTGSIGVFLALTISRLSSAAVWFDESFSVFMTRFNFDEITSLTAADVHPPVYYYLIKLWSMLFGNSAVAIRSMSIFFAVIAIILAFILVKKLFNRKTAALAAILLAISPIMVRYGIEARMYMVVLVIALSATLMLLRVMRTNSWRDYLIYGTLVSLGMWTHYFTAVVWIGHWVYRAVVLRLDEHKGKTLIKSFFSAKWLAAFGWAILLYLPWLPTLLRQFGSVAGGFWIPPINVNTPSEYLTDVLIYREGDQPSGWLAILVFVTVGLLIAAGIKAYQHLHGKSNRRHFWLVFTLALAPVVTLLILSLPPMSSVFIDRYLITSIVFMVILFAVVIASQKKSLVASLSLVAVVACSIIGIVRVNYYNNNTLYNALIGQVVKQVESTDSSDAPIVITDPYAYYVGAMVDDSRLYLTTDSIESNQTGSLNMLRGDKVKKTGNNLDRFLANHSQAWVIGITDDDTVETPDNTTDWQAQRTITVTNPTTGDQNYKATLYKK